MCQLHFCFSFKKNVTFKSDNALNLDTLLFWKQTTSAFSHICCYRTILWYYVDINLLWKAELLPPRNWTTKTLPTTTSLSCHLQFTIVIQDRISLVFLALIIKYDDSTKQKAIFLVTETLEWDKVHSLDRNQLLLGIKKM